MKSLIGHLQAIETLLEKAIDSPEWTELLKSDCYSPDITLPDALQAVRQAIFSCQHGKRRIPYTNEYVGDAPWLTGDRSRSTDGTTYGDFLAYDNECAAQATKNAESLVNKDSGVLSNDDKT